MIKPNGQAIARTAGRSGPGATFKHLTLAHGGGGQLQDELLHELVLPALGSTPEAPLLDSAAIGRDLALTIDSYVVQPWRFPGGDVGRLAVCGTVNDLAVCGAMPIGLALSLIMPEGTPREDVETVLASIRTALEEAGTRVLTGDTKVVARDDADGFYITTAGVGRVHRRARLSPGRVEPGDRVIVSGPLGEHGLAVMLAREMPELESSLQTDAAPLNGLVEDLLDRFGEAISFMRDPTRGGLSTLAVDLAQASGWRVVLEETALPIDAGVEHAAEMLGLDPLEIANEGKLVATVRGDAADDVLAVMHAHARGRGAAIVGRVEDIRDGRCELHTGIGGRRIVQKPYGEQLPRIC